jgi:hypothetical protein
MSLSARAFSLALCLFPFILFAPFGCKSAGGQASGTGAGSDISGPPVFDAVHQARLPRKCTTVTKPPSAGQAVVLAQCSMEALDGTMGGGNLSLVQNVKLQMGTPRAFLYQTDAGLEGVDVEAKITPLRGSYTSYFCGPVNNMAPAGHNCMKGEASDAVGWCWKTTFGDFKCALLAKAAPAMVADNPAPTNY